MPNPPTSDIASKIAERLDDSIRTAFQSDDEIAAAAAIIREELVKERSEPMIAPGDIVYRLYGDRVEQEQVEGIGQHAPFGRDPVIKITTNRGAGYLTDYHRTPEAALAAKEKT